MQGTDLRPNSIRETLAFMAWAERRGFEFWKVRLSAAAANGDKDGVAAATKELMLLAVPGSRRMQKAQDERGRKMLDKFRKKPLTIGLAADEDDNMSLSLEG